MKERVFDSRLAEEIAPDDAERRARLKALARGLVGVVRDGLVRDGSVRIHGFGTFQLRPTAARVGRNPRTGERIRIPAGNRVIFRPAKALRERIEPAPGAVVALNEPAPSREAIWADIPTPPRHVPGVPLFGLRAAGEPRERNRVAAATVADPAYTAREGRDDPRADDASTIGPEAPTLAAAPGATAANEETAAAEARKVEAGTDQEGRRRSPWLLLLLLLVAGGLGGWFAFERSEPPTDSPADVVMPEPPVQPGDLAPGIAPGPVDSKAQSSGDTGRGAEAPPADASTVTVAGPGAGAGETMALAPQIVAPPVADVTPGDAAGGGEDFEAMPRFPAIARVPAGVAGKTGGESPVGGSEIATPVAPMPRLPRIARAPVEPTVSAADSGGSQAAMRATPMDGFPRIARAPVPSGASAAEGTAGAQASETAAVIDNVPMPGSGPEGATAPSSAPATVPVASSEQAAVAPGAIARPTDPGAGRSDEPYFAATTYRVEPGDTLWWLAERHYVDPFYWPHIFNHNRDGLDNPDHLRIGQMLLLPTLQGEPTDLTEADRRSIAEGYWRLYRFWRDQGYSNADYALIGVRHFDESVLPEAFAADGAGYPGDMMAAVFQAQMNGASRR